MSDNNFINTSNENNINNSKIDKIKNYYNNNFKNKNNNKRAYKDYYIKKFEAMTKAKRNKSDSDTDINDNNINNENIINKIKKLESIIQTQKKKIDKLEKKTKDFNKKGSMLEDAVNDIYDIIEDWNDEYGQYYYDPEYIPKILNFSNLDLNDDNTITTRSKINYTDNNYKSILGNKNTNKNKNNNDKINCKDIPNKNFNNNSNDNIDIELTNNDLKNIYSENGDKYLEYLIKDAIKTNNPDRYIEEYCKQNNLSTDKHKEILNDYKEFKELNQKIYTKTESKISDIDAFINNESNKRKLIIESLKNINNRYINYDNYKFKILTSGMNTFVQQQALYKIKQLENTEVGTGEYYKLKNWLDTLTTIPFNNYKTLNLESNTISNFLENSRKAMDNVIYGQHNTKDIIIQIIAKMISNPNKSGNVFAIYGPPGVGKTTIIKEGMSKALGLPFAFLSLGGASDSSFLEGHGYTYEGSTPGKIVDILRKVECMNPILYFDELDKISQTRKGEEIANLLIHLTDPSQNNHFQDKYLGDIDLDLSKSIFVFSFNNINNVNPILLDRMELIYVNGFNDEEKINITKNYLIPELLNTYNLYTIKKHKGRPKKNITNDFKEPDIIFTDDNINYIINFEKINNTDKNKVIDTENGVRNIKRRIEKICSTINIVKITKGNWTSNIHSILDNCEDLKNSSYPITLSNDTIKKILFTKTNNTDNDINNDDLQILHSIYS